jgi:hypothetical protein
VLERFGRLESRLEGGPYQPYRSILAGVVRGFGAELGFSPTAAEVDALAASLGDWPPFADTTAALAALAGRFKLGIISNVDDDLFAQTARRLQVPFEWVTTAQQARAYKPSTAPPALAPSGWCTLPRACSTTTCRRISWGCRACGSTAGTTARAVARHRHPVWRPTFS